MAHKNHFRIVGLVFCFVCLLALSLLVAGCGGTAQSSPTNTPEPKPTETSPPPSPTRSPTPEPTDTPVPTDTPEPTDTPTPDLAATEQAQATQAAEAVMAEIGKELEAIGMSTDTGYLGWVQEEPVDISISSYDEFFYTEFAENLSASDFVLKTDVTWESKGGLAVCGFIFRSEPNMDMGAQYVFEMIRLSGLPGWDIIYLKFDQFQKNVTGMLTSGAIDQDNGALNKIILIAEGEKFTLYVNDQRVGSYYDYGKSRMDGYFAFTAWQQSGETTCSYDNSWVWMLK